MELVNVIINNYKGIQNETLIKFREFCCIVGKTMLASLQFSKLWMLF